MNKNRKLFNLQLFTGGASITRTDAEALIPTQESQEIIQGTVEQSAVLQCGRRLANMTAAQWRMPVLDLLPLAYFVNGEGGAAKKKLTTMAWDKKMVALRAVMRLGWEIPNPINAMAKDKAKRCPFAIMTAPKANTGA